MPIMQVAKADAAECSDSLSLTESEVEDTSSLLTIARRLQSDLAKPISEETSHEQREYADDHTPDGMHDDEGFRP